MPILMLNGNIYELNRTTVDTCLRMAKGSFKKQNAIVAVEKDDVVDMKRDVFISKPLMDIAIKEYEAQGFLVHRVYK